MRPKQTPLRIVYVSWEYPPQFGGGIGTYVHAAARMLAARGHEVSVVTTGREPHPTRKQRDGVNVLRPTFTGGREDSAIETLRTWQNRADAVSDLLIRLVRGGVDLIEFCDYRGEGVSYLTSVAPERRPVCVVRLHTPLSVLNRYNASRTRHAVLEEFEHQALGAADRLVSPSAALASEMRARLDGAKPIDLSPHPVDRAFLDTTPASEACRGSDVLYVGRFEQRKGVETLVRAAAGFLDACPKARLVMVGGDTPKGPNEPSMRGVVKRMIAERHRGRVALLDAIPRDELMHRYREARSCVFPSHFENFPNTCLEAMSLGKCVIGTSNSGMAEIIEDGVSGVLVESANVDALAKALIDTFSAADEWRVKVGRAARLRIEQQYHPDVIAPQLEHLYRGYVEAHARKPSAATYRSTDPPRVAVVIPCFNHGRFVGEAVESAIGQSYQPLDVVIVDDGSTDDATCGVLDRIESDRVRVVRQENAGLAAARNAGVNAAGAEFFVPLDADDKLDREFVARLIEPLRRDASLGYCYCHAALFGAHSSTWECPAYDPQKLLVENLSVATAVIRRKAFDEAGGYNTDMIHGFEDWDFWLSLLAAGWQGKCVPRVLFHYRQHAEGSMLAQTQKHRAEMVKRMVMHHRALFASMLEVSIGRKDEMFFQAHTDAWRLREHVASGGGASGTTNDGLYQSLLAKAELDCIENSRFWRAAQRFGFARARKVRDHDAGEEGETIERRLASIKASRTYRMIRALKRSGLYKWYARRKYGPDHEQQHA